ncbi:MAG: hypothetical protein MJZ68_00065 [archaeon]|nr:hypothetical protein [archaeon]
MADELFSGTMGEMDLIERHIRMLKEAKKYQPVGIIRLSETLGIPKHKVRYSLRLLERDGLIEATPEGAVVTEKYDEFMSALSSRLDDIVKRANEIRDSLSDGQ